MGRMIAMVTGGTGGIGSAICQRLATHYQVVACYFKNKKHDEALHWQKEQKRFGFDIDIAYADVTEFADCEHLASCVMEKYGHIDVLVNNAGITNDSRLQKMSQQQWQQVMDANLTSVFNMTRNVLPFMLDQSFGRIITVSSINGRKGQFGQSNYASSKAALFGFTKSLALEVANKGITVNTVSPGYIKTPMLDTIRTEVLDSIVANIPMGRLGEPMEIANTVAFLASKECGFITGANIDVNGGQYM